MLVGRIAEAARDVGDRRLIERRRAVLVVRDLTRQVQDRLALGLIEDAGAVDVIYGGANGLDRVSRQLWTADLPDVEGAAEQGAPLAGSSSLGIGSLRTGAL